MKETGAMTEAGEITSEVISPYRAFKTSHNSYIAEPRNFSSNFKPEVYGLPRVSSTSAPPILPAVYGDPATTTTAAAATTVATAVASLASLRVAFALCEFPLLFVDLPVQGVAQRRSTVTTRTHVH
uniref:Uncharacterized protein n=1 Tax=Schistocephalus solidus TaxID=70667 RepID=A0A0V0J6W7_SCHSO